MMPRSIGLACGSPTGTGCTSDRTCCKGFTVFVLICIVVFLWDFFSTFFVMCVFLFSCVFSCSRSEMPRLDPGALLRVLGSQEGGGQTRGQAVRPLDLEADT